MITVEGGNRKLRALAEKAAIFAWNKLIPEDSVCFVTISLNNIEHGDGFCWEEDDNDYAIEVNSKLTGDDFLTAIFHEMTHVKQYVKGELLDDDIFYKTHEEYINQPHEVEAYRVQEELLELWNKAA